MIRSRVTTPVLVVLASLVLLSPWSLGGRPAFASAADEFRESVLVTGTGEVSATPDTLTADFAVEATATTVAQALDRATVAATRMHDALARRGVDFADLQTSNFSIGSKVNDDQAIVGYTVNKGLTAKIRDLRRAGELMSAAIAAGGDAARLNGVSFAVENDGALLAEARKKAFADARQKAELYAHEAGRPLSRVLTVSDTATGAGPIGQFGSAAMDLRSPIEPGRQQLSVTVTVEWALDPLPKHA
jgi:uncharacterized protein YggE